MFFVGVNTKGNTEPHQNNPNDQTLFILEMLRQNQAQMIQMEERINKRFDETNKRIDVLALETNAIKLKIKKIKTVFQVLLYGMYFLFGVVLFFVLSFFAQEIKQMLINPFISLKNIPDMKLKPIAKKPFFFIVLILFCNITD